MPTEVVSPRVCRFNGFEVDFQAGQLRRNGAILPVQPKALELLRALLERPGEVVTREELRLKLWGSDTFVQFDDSLNHAVKKLRQALGDTSEAARFIETLPRHGYRFIAPTEIVAEGERPSPGRARPLRRRAIFGVIGLGLALVTTYGVQRLLHQPAPPAERRVLLAVLPFDNLSANQSQAHIADGFTEELLTELARLNPAQLGVIARTSSSQFKNSGKGVDQIARQLGVDYLVEGSVRAEGSRTRVSVQLIGVQDQTHIWANVYDRESGSLLDLETEIAAQVGRSIAVRLLPRRLDQPAPAHRPTPDARDARLLGRYYLTHRTGDSLVKARKAFEKALALDPDYPEAFADLAKTYVLLVNYQVLPRREGKPKARELAVQALELDPSLSDARVVLAGVMTETEWNFAGAEAEFARVIRDDPNNALAHQWYSAHLSALGRFEEAIHHMKVTCQLDPLSLSATVDLGRAYYFARRHDEATAQYRRALNMDPNYASAHSLLGLALIEQRQYAAAIRELQAGIALMPGSRSLYLPYAHAVAGHTDEARVLLRGLLQEWEKSGTHAMGIALAYLGLGEHDRAFPWLEREFHDRSGAIMMLRAYPYWDPIRSDPRYTDLLRRAGLLAAEAES